MFPDRLNKKFRVLLFCWGFFCILQQRNLFMFFIFILQYFLMTLSSEFSIHFSKTRKTYGIKQIHFKVYLQAFFSFQLLKKQTILNYCLMKDYILPWANSFHSDIKKAKENDTACERLPYFKPEAAS